MDTDFALNSARMIRKLGDRAFAKAMVDCVDAAHVDYDWGFIGHSDSEVDAILSQASENFLPAEWWMSPTMEVACRTAIGGRRPINVVVTPMIYGFGSSDERSFILGIGAITAWREVEVSMQFTADGKTTQESERLMVPAEINPARAMLVGFDGSSFIAI